MTTTSPLPGTAATEASPRRRSYDQILKSSALIGGSSAITIVFGIVRMKAMAVLLGPAGVGLMGLYNAIADLAQSIAGLGINSSGVRQIAEAVGSGEAERVARTATALRRVSVLLGLIGAGLLLLLAKPVSRLTFGNAEYVAGVSLLSVVVFLRLVSAGQGALIQGMRRVEDLARMGIWGALFGTVFSIALVFWLGERGIVPALVMVGVMSALASWWYSRKVKLQSRTLTLAQAGKEVSGLLKLGLVFMVSGLLTMGAAYAIRGFILQTLGFDAAGLYQAAWVLGGLYVGFILQAMGADFYPRLTAVARDHAECNRLVNEQAQIGLLMAGPGVTATLALAPVVLAVFYSTKFAGAVEILRWICLGMTLRVVAWPMGFILLAKGVQSAFFWTEVIATTVHVGLAVFAVRHFGLAGAGMAFFGLYVFHGFLIYVIVRRLTGFRWSAPNRRIGCLFLALTGFVFSSFYFLPEWLASTVGALLAVASGIYALRAVLKLVSLDRLPAPLRRLIQWSGLA